MKTAARQQGGTLIEVLVAMLIVAFGALGFVGLQARTAVSTLEGYQRAQALVLLNDIAQRMSANRAAAASYVGDNVGVADPGACPASPLAAKDLCEWSNLLRGAAVQQGGNQVGAVQAARGCITALGSNRYLLAVVWQGVQSTAPASLACGQNAYASEAVRRGVSLVLQVADLSAP